MDFPFLVDVLFCFSGHVFTIFSSFHSHMYQYGLSHSSETITHILAFIAFIVSAFPYLLVVTFVCTPSATYKFGSQSSYEYVSSLGSKDERWWQQMALGASFR